jgi:hypothetical protein
MTRNTTTIFSGSRIWLWLSMAAVLLEIVGNVIALSVKGIYSVLTPVFFPQAIAQDIASLVLVSPLWLILAALALRGSLRSYLLWLGVLFFTAYNYVIYTFSVPFGPLFPLWVVVFGLALYALIGGITSVDHKALAATFTSRRATKVVGWALIVVVILFAFLWLSEDVPALLSGTRPQSLVDMALPTNPVHILDLSFFLPGAFIVAIMLLKGRPLGFALAPAALTFLILTGIPILITPVVQSARGETAGWGVVIPIGTLTVILAGLLVWLVHTIQTKTLQVKA